MRSSSADGVQVVWFKRDLRTTDHRPLAEAARRGRVVALYVYEPAWLDSAEFDPSHFSFVDQSLEDLDAELRELGIPLTRRRGDFPGALTALAHELASEGGIAGLWSHEETGLRWSFDRDLAVAAWCRASGVPWQEFPSNGVVRRLRDRDGWSRIWLQRMAQLPVARPDRLTGPPDFDHGRRLDLADLELPPSARGIVQRGGVGAAHDTLRSFLSIRGENYRTELSSPETGAEGCSRLSPYLAWGNLSVREVFHATRRRIARLQARPSGHREWLASLQAYESRLRWHCHFIQRLEDEPAIEFENIHRGFDGLRESEFDEGRFVAWSRGETGYPMVDACMRALHETGWINFRMRAMLVSFASHHLWLHWRKPAIHLGRLFLDFEPGIHFSQMQMQSGVTGINTVRIYSPEKQAADQDPTGAFVRRHVPELAGVPDEYLAAPHRMSDAQQSAAGCRIGKDYPAPIVDHATAYRRAKQRIAAVPTGGPARATTDAVFRRHGSRSRRRFGRSRS